jgi:benzoate/toluate 1,2-dioxygenase beta subunit/2,4,5-trichlorophenoxyacetic acid oxygenase 2
MPRDTAEQVLAKLGLALDRQQWDAWLAMFTEDCTYWVPAWTDEHVTTQDPDTEVSLIYHDNRWGLEERILRIRTRKSVTAMPLPRTQHFVSNVLAEADGPDAISGTASFSVAVLETRTNRVHQHFGRYEFRLRQEAGVWRVAYNRVVLMNDVVPTILDFYCL